MSLNIPGAAQLSKLDPAAPIFVPNELTQDVQDKGDYTEAEYAPDVNAKKVNAIDNDDSSAETSSQLDDSQEISDDEIATHFDQICGNTHWDIHDEEDWMAAIIDQDNQIASDYMDPVSRDLCSDGAKVLAIDASDLVEGVKCTDDEANDFNKLPGEIRNKIFKLALTAENGIISMPCLSNKAFEPNIATALLRTCKQVYVEARNHLYTANTVVFDHVGSDIKDIAKLAYPKGVNGPAFSTIILDVGDANVDYEGFFKAKMFANALKGMRHPIHVEHLKIEFRSFSLNKVLKPEDFSIGLGNFKVRKTMIMYGNDYHWDHGDMRAVPRALKMRFQPTFSDFYPRNEALVDPRPGFFVSTYEPAKGTEQIAGVEGENLFDAGVQYMEWCKTHPS